MYRLMLAAVAAVFAFTAVPTASQAHWKKDKSAWTASWDAHWAKKRAACAAWKASWDAHWAKKKAHFHKSK